uniref:Uncharacterized protein n=1 Tax=Rhizophora mucronata TaxID=61149 RepID=A0A2P2N7J5_RHIMU
MHQPTQERAATIRIRIVWATCLGCFRPSSRFEQTKIRAKFDLNISI